MRTTRWSSTSSGPTSEGPADADDRRPRDPQRDRPRRLGAKDGYVADVAVAGERIAAVGQGRPRARRDGWSTPTGWPSPRLHRHARPLRPAILADRDHLAKVSGRDDRGPRAGRTRPRAGRRRDHGTRARADRRLEREPEGVDFAWERWPTTRSRSTQGIACNVALPGAAGNLRIARRWATRTGPRRRPSSTEMRRAARQGMPEGALGMSRGLTYPPGMFADTDELVALCAVVAETAASTARTQRSYGAGALEAYAEMVDVAWRSGCALHLTHATMNFEPTADARGSCSPWSTAALADGVDVTLGHLPVPPRLDDAERAAARAGPLAGGTDAHAGTARGPGDPRARIAHELETSAPTAATAARSTGTRSRSRGARAGRWRPRSGARSPRSLWSAGAAGRGVLRPAGRGPAGDHASCSTSGTRRTSAPIMAAPACTAAGRTRSWSARSRTRGPGGRSRATSVTTCARRACSTWPTASDT